MEAVSTQRMELSQEKQTDTTSLNLKTGNATCWRSCSNRSSDRSCAVYRNTVTAMIGNYNTVTAKSILVQAIADRDITGGSCYGGRRQEPQVSTEVSWYFPSAQATTDQLMPIMQKPMEAAILPVMQVMKHQSVARRQWIMVTARRLALADQGNQYVG